MQKFNIQKALLILIVLILALGLAGSISYYFHSFKASVPTKAEEKPAVTMMPIVIPSFSPADRATLISQGEEDAKKVALAAGMNKKESIIAAKKAHSLVARYLRAY